MQGFDSRWVAVRPCPNAEKVPMRDPAPLRPFDGRTADDIAPVWVLDDPLESASDQAIGIAERLGVPHLRVPLSWRWRARMAGLTRHGSLAGLLSPGWPFSAPRGPALAISASRRSEAVALWLRNSFGTRVVHCGRPRWRGRLFDLLVVPQHLQPTGAGERAAGAGGAASPLPAGTLAGPGVVGRPPVPPAAAANHPARRRRWPWRRDAACRGARAGATGGAHGGRCRGGRARDHDAPHRGRGHRRAGQRAGSLHARALPLGASPATTRIPR